MKLEIIRAYRELNWGVVALNKKGLTPSVEFNINIGFALQLSLAL